MPSTIVIVPTYNEAENLPVLAARLLALDPPLEVLCVDDGSPDGTGRIADGLADLDARFRVIHRAGPRGYARACAEGMLWALAAGYEVVCTMDADLSHDPDSLPALLSAIATSADVAIGSRYVEGGSLEVDWGPVRSAISKAGSGYARAMVGTKVHDCTSGFRCYRADVLGRLPLGSIRSDGYSFLIELLAMLTAEKARIVEVPIAYVDRRVGTSKISRAIVLEALGVATGLGLRRLARPGRRAND